MALAPGGVGRASDMVVQCPYDPNHIITNVKLSSHLEKCRKAFKVNALRKKEPIDSFVCQYNYNHIVLAPELVFHESRCPDRNTIRSYQLNVAPLREAGLWPYELDLESFPPDEKEARELFGGVALGTVQGRDDYGKVSEVDDIKFPKLAAQRRAEEKGKKLAEELQKEEKRKKEMEETGLTQEELDEIDDWNKEQPGPGFDFKKVMRSLPPSKQMHSPYFSKEERRKNVKMSDAEWFQMKTDEKRRAEEEARKAEGERRMAMMSPTPGTSGASQDGRLVAGLQRMRLVDDELLDEDEERLAKVKKESKVKFHLG